MKIQPREWWTHVALLSAVVLLCGWMRLSTRVYAGVVGSPHDFSAAGPYTQSTAVAPSGTCSACHIPHGADPNASIWARSLSLYVSRLTMNGDTSGKPNYILPPALACYDCHDDHGAIDDNPPFSAFSSGYKPQDIAFGGDGPGGTKAGYYEHNPPNPSGGSYGVYSYPGQFNPTNPDNLAKTGGHYFKTDPNSSARPDIGDKLPCRDCHDPHSSLQAFIRTGIPSSGANPGLGSSYTSVTASTYMTNNTGRTRSNAESRKICVQCHGYSNNGTPLKFSQISTAYTNSSDNVPKPPNTVSDHNSSASSACVSCHNHNSVGASCTTCHGYPPPGYPAGNTPSAYGAGADSHTKHVSGYSLTCGICHSDNTHQDNVVQVAFDPVFLGGKLSSGTDDNTSVPPGGTRCQNLYCHSSGRDGITPSTDSTHYAKYATLQWGVMNGQIRCNGCHGAFANDNVAGDFSADNTTMRYGAPNYRNSGTPGSATSNSHKAHVGTYECSVCHGNVASGYASQSRSITNATLHVNGSRNITFTGVAAGGSYDPTPGQKSCTVSCHGAGTPKWGGSVSGCSDCHLSSNPDSDVYLNHTSSNNIYDANQAGNINAAEWTYSGHGKTTGTYDVSLRPAANFTGGDPCYFCHNPSVSHDNAANPFRLKDQTAAAAYLSAKGWNATCLVCHYHSTAPIGYNPFGGTNIPATAAFTDNAHYGADHVAAGTNGGKFCWDCHDPHGDRPSSGVNNIYMIQGGSTRTAPAVGQLLKQSDGTHGFRGTTANAMTTTAPVFAPSSTPTGTDYVDNTNVSKNGICQVCHTTASHWTATSGDGHNAGTRCTQCHTHDSGFAPSDCKGCHGGNDGLSGAAGAPYVTRYWGDSGTTGIKSGHGRATSPTIGCEDCHNAGLPGGTTHKANNTSGTAPYNINTEHWPGKTRTTDTDPNTNTSHLKAAYMGSGTDAQKQVAFDDACYTLCHSGKGVANHRHTQQTPRNMEFGRKGTTSNPKQYVWNNNSSWDYKNDFYKSWSPWTIRDLTTDTSYPGSMLGPHYGTCVSCHDPHGTGITDNTITNSGPSSGAWTNHMVRGKWKSDTAAFCNGACHRKP